MSILLQARSLTHSAGGGLLFRDLNLAIAVGDRLGLVGHNGSGKTTLLGLLSGAEEPDGGDVMRKRGLRLGMVEQFLPTELGSDSALEAVARNAPDEELWTAQSLLSALGFAENEFQEHAQILLIRDPSYASAPRAIR